MRVPSLQFLFDSTETSLHQIDMGEIQLQFRRPQLILKDFTIDPFSFLRRNFSFDNLCTLLSSCLTHYFPVKLEYFLIQNWLSFKAIAHSQAATKYIRVFLGKVTLNVEKYCQQIFDIDFAKWRNISFKLHSHKLFNVSEGKSNHSAHCSLVSILWKETILVLDGLVEVVHSISFGAENIS